MEAAATWEPIDSLTPWDKIVYGSDTIPGLAADIVGETKVTHADYLRLFDSLNLSAGDRRKIMGGNAARILGLEDG